MRFFVIPDRVGNDSEGALFTKLYFKDIDRTEQVIYMKGKEVSDGVIKKDLIESSLS